MIDATLESWVAVPPGSDFPIQNLPYGVFVASDGESHVGVAIGDRILDLHACARAGLVDRTGARDALCASVLNPLLALGAPAWAAVRARLVELLRTGSDELRTRADVDAFFVERDAAYMRMPFAVGDYVDFYSSLEHATNLGKIFRPDGDPLLPNWKWLPVGYHGRSSTIVVDGTPIVRPNGQRKPPDAAAPLFGPSTSLDIELEVGFVTGPGNRMGTTIPADEAHEHIFGLLLVNDWSARDIQAWEYQPLGPFLGKSFATSVSPWVVTLDALEPFRMPGPQQYPPPLPYLRCAQPWNYDVILEVRLQSAQMRERNIEPMLISASNAKYLYWNIAQQLAHVTVNGTAIRPGDLYASGTISGSTPESYGSLIELTWRGAKPLTLPSGEKRAFLEDGDTVTMRGYCERTGTRRIGFGSVSGTIVSGDGVTEGQG